MTSRAEKRRNKQVTLTIQRSGATPKAGVSRYPGGQIVHSERKPSENASQIVATAVSQRMTRVHPEDAMKERAGYPLGRMRLNTVRGNSRWLITEKQCRAGEKWFEVVAAYLRSIDAPSPTARSCSFEGAGGKTLHLTPDMDPHANEREVAAYISRLKGRQNGYTSAVDAIEDSGFGWPDRLAVLNAVVIRDQDEMTLSAEEVGHLREALNTLDLHFEKASLDNRSRSGTTVIDKRFCA